MNLSSIVLAMVISLPPAYTDREETGREARMRTIAEAVTQATERACCEGYGESCEPIWNGRPEDLAALIVTKGWWESRFALNVHEGKCKPYECDPAKSMRGHITHLARTPWQFQRTGFSAPFWNDMVGTGLQPTRNAAWVAATILSRGYNACRSFEGALAWYAVGRCNYSKAGNRHVTFRKLQTIVDSKPAS